MTRRTSIFVHTEGGIELIHADLHRFYWKNWRRALKAYLADPEDPYLAFEFLVLHPANQSNRLGFCESRLQDTLRWQLAKVDPETKRIETKKSKKGHRAADAVRNTETNVWLEWGPWEDDDGPRGGRGSHDPRTDTGGSSFEEALVNLAHNVWVLYRDRPLAPADNQLHKKDRW